MALSCKDSDGRETLGGPWKGEWWIYSIEICKLLMITTGGWAGSKFLGNFSNKALNLGRRQRRLLSTIPLNKRGRLASSKVQARRL
jgi:hypothetical protein